MKLRVIDVLNIIDAITDLEENGSKLNFTVGFDLYLNKKTCLEVSEYLFKKLEESLGKDKLTDINNMTQDDKKVYNDFLLSEIDVDLKPININLLLNRDINCSLKTIKTLVDLFDGKEIK